MKKKQYKLDREPRFFFSPLTSTVSPATATTRLITASVLSRPLSACIRGGGVKTTTSPRSGERESLLTSDIYFKIANIHHFNSN